MNFNVQAAKPSTFIEALLAEEKRDHLEGMDFSVTSLLQTPRQFQLTRRHKDELPERSLDSRLATFIGHAIHKAVEKSVADNPDYLIEHKMLFEEEVDGITVRVGGTCDMYDKVNKRLIDHKTTTTFLWGGELKQEWIEQLNIYAHLLRKLGYEVEKLTINCVYKDWRPTAGRYKEDSEYPPLPVMEFNFDPWPADRAEEFYKERLREHVRNGDVLDDILPLCDDTHMWSKPSSFAVYRPGAVKAIRVLPTKRDAELYIRSKKLDGCKIEHRVGERTRCEKYCSAAPFCSQFQKWKEEQNKQLAEDLLDETKVA